jgi:hypothetical protein
MIASTVTQFSCMGESTFAKEVGRTAGLYTLRALTFKTLLQIELSASRFAMDAEVRSACFLYMVGLSQSSSWTHCGVYTTNKSR